MKEKGKIFKVIWSVFTSILVVIVLLLTVALVGVRLLGFTPYAILSPSMMPVYQVGDLVYVKSTEMKDIKVGDVITFVANEELLVVTHRVAEADYNNHSFITKGDANDSNDVAPVIYENIVGVVKFSLPKLGYLSIYLGSESGRYMGTAIIFALILLSILPEFFKNDKDKKKENP